MVNSNDTGFNPDDVYKDPSIKVIEAPAFICHTVDFTGKTEEETKYNLKAFDEFQIKCCEDGITKQLQTGMLAVLFHLATGIGTHKKGS